jgi:hypothetical protein
VHLFSTVEHPTKQEEWRMNPARARRFRSAALALVVVSLVLAGAPAPAAAQEWSTRFDGRVQWVAGQLMVVYPDVGSSVTVDLLRVPQGEYAGLTVGDRVTIIGVIRNGNRRIIGTSVLRTETQAP